MTDASRRRLIALVSATAKLDAAANLTKIATIDLARVGFQREPVQKIADEIAIFVARITLALKEIPST